MYRPKQRKIPLAKVLLFFAVSVAFSCSANCQGVNIVKNGQAVAVIVSNDAARATVAKGKSRGFECSDTTAVKVLADWIEKITDVRLQVVHKPQKDKAAIYVGAAAIEAGVNLEDINSTTSEGLHIISDGKAKVLIAGQSDVATVKAVCRFLEELGCRYFMDHKLGEVYPRKTTLTVGKFDITEKPGFMLRRIWGSRWTGQSLWKVWNGAGGLPMATGHAWGKYVDQDLFDTHPEYFALRDGRRRKGAWYCTSNPELRKVFARGLISYGGCNPSLSPPDGTGYCQCDRCRSQDDHGNIEPSSGLTSVTNRYMDFFDDVARKVAGVHPDWLLSFYCYADYTQPPTLGRKLASNLIAWIAPLRYSRYHCIGGPNSSSRMQLARVIDGWASAVDHIAYRTYNFNCAECLVPFSKLGIWKHDIPYLKQKGCIGINLESLANWEIYGPHLYHSIRLAYDPEADSDALMDDYFMKFYGLDSGPFMKQYWLSIDKAFADLKCESGSFYALHLVYTPQFLKKLQGLVENATSAVETDETYAARVAMTGEGLKNAVQYIRIREAINKGDFTSAKKIYDDLFVRNEAELSKGFGNHYTLNYLKRFVGQHIKAGTDATSPPNKVLTVLPDRMKLTYDHDNTGQKKGYYRPNFDDSKWKEVNTYSNTLNAQGLPDKKSILWYRTVVDIPRRHGPLGLFFTEVDGQSVVVYVNGNHSASIGKEARRKPFEVDITEDVKPGKNVVAVKIDHTRITELFLGGIVRPVLLIEKGAR